MPSVEADLETLDAGVRRQVLRRLVWLSDNADQVIHHRMSNLPDDLAGLCRFRVGQYRSLSWVYPQHQLLKVYKVEHRSEVYRRL